MKFHWSSVAWSIAALLLILLLFTPFQILTICFTAVPIVILYTTLNKISFAVHMLLIWLAAFLLLGTYGSVAILFSIYFMIPAIVIGRLYKKKSHAMTVLFGGLVTVLVESLIMLFILTLVMKFDFYSYLADAVHMSLDPLQKANLMPVDWTPKMTDDLIVAMGQMIPFALIFSALVITAITHAVSRPFLKSMKYDVPAFKPLKDWMLPRSLVWYYFIAVILDMIFSRSGSAFLTIILVNLLPLLKIAFMVQTICFFFFVADLNKWPKAVAWVFVIPLLIFPPLRIIGLLDIAFPIRQGLKPKM